MQFNNFPRKEISYEKKMQIEENKEKVEMTLECIRVQLPYAVFYNSETDSLRELIASVADRSDDNGYFIDYRIGPQTKEQRKMMFNIEHISDLAQEGIKMNFIVDMENRRYVSACKDEDIGTCLCSLYPVNATKPVMLMSEENQRQGLYVYVGKPSQDGKAYLFAKDKKAPFFIQLQELHFLSLRKDAERNYYHGLLLSYNVAWGWRNISFSIILKENQEAVWQMFDSVRSAMQPVGQTNSAGSGMGDRSYSYPWQ